MAVSKRDKQHLMKGALIGAVVGAFLPDSINPYFVVRGILDKLKGA